MNILILSGQFGLGHKMAAKAISEELQQLDKTANIVELDLLGYCYPRNNAYLVNTFNVLVERYHSMYNLLYKLSCKMRVSIKPVGMNIYKRLQCLIDEYKPDLIISTLHLCSNIIASYKEKTGCNIPLVTCITDISSSREWISPQTDFYLAPTSDIKNNLISKGIKKDQIFVTGIPVRKQFCKQTQDIKTTLCKQKKIVIMGGGLGIMPQLKKLLDILSKENNVHTTVITGKNRKAYEHFKQHYCNVDVLDYVESISDYINQADLVITKAGGITMFELINSGVPSFIVYPFLEQEVKNAQFAEQIGISKVVWSKHHKLESELKHCLDDDKQLQSMKECVNTAQHEIPEVSVCDAMQFLLERASA